MLVGEKVCEHNRGASLHLLATRLFPLNMIVMQPPCVTVRTCLECISVSKSS